jgi:NAD(P)-dependent dehydrogenase (short-subunit alcohol dehydrogenase family)
MPSLRVRMAVSATRSAASSPPAAIVPSAWILARTAKETGPIISATLPIWKASMSLSHRVSDTYGPIGRLVNNAGHYHAKPFLEITPDDFDRTFAVNVRAIFFSIQIAARQMIQASIGGVITNVTSLSGHTGSAVTDYGASKAATNNMTKGLAKTLAPHKIRVNAVAPGFTDTAMGKRGEPLMVARTLAALPLGRAARGDCHCRGVSQQRCGELRHRYDFRRQRGRLLGTGLVADKNTLSSGVNAVRKIGILLPMDFP